MAVWVYAYGKNGLVAEMGTQSIQYLDILNNIPLDEVKILDSISEIKNPDFSIRQYYTDNRKPIEASYKSMTADEYKAYLDLLKLPFIEIDRIVDHFISVGEKTAHEKELHFQFVYDQFKNRHVKSKWELADGGSFVNKLLYFDAYDGLRLRILNDLIWISGPFPIFSLYSRFLEAISHTSRDYYHSYFKNIFRAFKSDFILYAHEWSGLDDEEDKEFNITKLQAQSNWRITSSDSIHTMKSFYYEQL